MVAERLGWTLYDARIIETIAGRMERPIEEVEALDELSPSVVQDWLLPLREEHWAPLEAYLDHLAKLVLSIGHGGDAVIVGRGAGFMIPRHARPCRSASSPRSRPAPAGSPSASASPPGPPAGWPATSTAAATSSPGPCSTSTTTDPHRYDLVLDTESVGLPDRLRADRPRRRGRPSPADPPRHLRRRPEPESGADAVPGIRTRA